METWYLDVLPDVLAKLLGFEQVSNPNQSNGFELNGEDSIIH